MNVFDHRKEAAGVTQEQWFETTYHQYADFLTRISRRLLTDGNEDALYDAIQETFLLLWDRRAELQSHPNIGGWLVEAVKFRILGSRAKVTRRALRHAYSLDEEDAMQPQDSAALSPEQNAVLQNRLDQLRELLGEENASLFIDYTLNGYSAKDLAQRYGVSESCIWMRISRMKKKLMVHPEIFYAVLLILTGFGSANA